MNKACHGLRAGVGVLLGGAKRGGASSTTCHNRRSQDDSNRRHDPDYVGGFFLGLLPLLNLRSLSK